MERDLSAAGVAIAVLNYNGRPVLPDCLDSIRRLASAPGEILLVDDGSTDGSPAWVRSHYPEVRVVELGANTRCLNKVRNRALREAERDLVLLVDNDVVLRPDCLRELLAAMAALPNAAVCMPRTLYQHDPGRIYQDGQVLHYVGATCAINRNHPLAEADSAPRLSIGWGVQLIDRRKAMEVGLFNEEYVMGWGDDGEFNHKMNLAGHFCYHVPTAVVYHKRVSGARRYYGSVRNRWRFLLECYQLRTLLLCAPGLLAYEVAQVAFLAMKGALRDYLRAAAYIGRNLPAILRERRRIQRRRRVGDAQLMGSGEIFIVPEYVDSPVLAVGIRVLSAMLDLNWRLVRPFI
ncbi:MAG TPA: glycosyltransferase [Longimicrobiales bacterium]